LSYFSVTNLAHQLGSNKLIISSLKKSHPHWNIKDVLKKTGIKKLYLSNENEDVLNLSIKSCKKTLKNFDKKKIDCVIAVTQTAKNKLPSISCMIQDQLNLRKNIIAFDIGLGCSGFVYGLSIINSLLSSNTVKTVLFVCGDTYNKFLNEQNRTCKTVFSDAASSCIVQKINSKKNVKFSFLTDGSGASDLMENNNNIEMKGSNIFHFTTKNIPDLFNDILKKNNLKKNDIDQFVFHQASKLVLDKLTKILELDENKVFKNYDQIGNTVSSSIPIALENLKKNNMLKKNQKIMLVGFGVGLSAAASIINWT
jgi:3-oxoacyl-[acyl-carrier-protein] synthase III